MEQYAKELQDYAYVIYHYLTNIEGYNEDLSLEEIINQYEMQKKYSTDIEYLNDIEDIADIPEMLYDENSGGFNCDKDELIKKLNKTKYWQDPFYEKYNKKDK